MILSLFHPKDNNFQQVAVENLKKFTNQPSGLESFKPHNNLGNTNKPSFKDDTRTTQKSTYIFKNKGISYFILNFSRS